MYNSIPVLITLALGATLANAEPMITAAAALQPRQAVDPSLVGYISASGGYSDGRTCDYPATVSTSSGYVQCCAATGSCVFYTACSSNTLVAAGGTTVPCDTNTAFTCNTALILPTTGATNPGSYLACWQKTLGSGPITFVQNVVGNSVASSSTITSTGSSSPSVTVNLSTATQGSTLTNPAGAGSATASSSTTSRNVAAGDQSNMSGGVLGFVALLVQALL